MVQVPPRRMPEAIATRICQSAALLLIALVVLSVPPARADYVTPGLGNDYVLDQLVAMSAGAVTGGTGQYQIHDSIVIAVSDTLSIGSDTEIIFVSVGGALRLEVNGSLIIHGDAPESVRFTSLNQNYGDYAGIDFRDTGPGSVFEMHYCTVEYAADAIDVVYADVFLENCAIRYSGSKAIDLTGSSSTIRDCEIHDNFKQTIYMTLGSSPLIEGNYIHGNNIENSSPYPFINIGLQGVNSPTIRENTIMGGNHMSGGIAIWNACNGLIEGNHIENCGYGIFCYQFDANPWIKNNTLLNNNIHPDTVNWGFGIACNGQNSPIVTGNIIQGHWYGVATINGGQPNLGDLVNDFPDDDGENQFLGNGLGGVLYELYNNTNLDLMAQNNWWGTSDPAEIEDRIVHSMDDPALGTVTFDPFLTSPPITAIENRDAPRPVLVLRSAYPNPFNPVTTLSFDLARDCRVEVRIFDVAGRRVRELTSTWLPSGSHRLTWNGRGDRGQELASGIYYYRISAAGSHATGKLVLVQ